MRDGEGNRGRDWETAVGSGWVETEKWETGLRAGRRELRRDGGTVLGGGKEERGEVVRREAGRDGNEQGREIRKGSLRDGVWEGWPLAGVTPGGQGSVEGAVGS